MYCGTFELLILINLGINENKRLLFAKENNAQHYATSQLLLYRIQRYFKHCGTATSYKRNLEEIHFVQMQIWVVKQIF